MPDEIKVKALTLTAQASGKEHWYTAGPYVKDHINKIDDPEGGQTHTSPTSVPSPFAQMDLVRASFNNIAREDADEFGGHLIDFKLISDCFDLGEVFFNYNRFRDQINLLTWSWGDMGAENDSNLKRLVNSPNQKHQRFGKALKLFIAQDATANNFETSGKFYLLEYQNKIIGGTSPTTLFFASANDLSWVDIKMPTGDRLFDQGYKHLYERDPDFQLYIYALEKAMMGTMGEKMQAFARYLRINKEILRGSNQPLYQQIIKLESKDYHNNYDKLTTGDNDVVSVLGNRLLVSKKGGNKEDVAGQQNDYTIAASRPLGAHPPMVLVKNHDGKSRIGETLKTPFSIDFSEVPYLSGESDIAKRVVPGLTNTKYPYLLAADFLEPYIIRLIYPINKERYFDGNLNRTRKEGDYILPIKRAFFDYFTTEDLMSKIMTDGNKMFEMETSGRDGLTVTLRIPIHEGKSYITYKRLYMEPGNVNEIPQPNEASNKGVLVDNQFSLTIFPFVKINAPEILPDYRIMLVDRDVQPHNFRNDYKLSFVNSENLEVKADDPNLPKIRSLKKQSVGETTQVYVIEKNFDFVQINNGLARGIVVPKFVTDSHGTTQFSFAIDFGTTNTHIEYKSNVATTPKPLDITDEDLQVGTLHDLNFLGKEDSEGNGDSRLLPLYTIPRKLLHERVGEVHNFNFPQRSILMENERLNYAHITYALADFNIPLFYEKEETPITATVTSNLKWSNYTAEGKERRRVEAFLEHLLFMIRAKVLLNNGDLAATEIIWFYPYSMNEGRINALEKDWKKLTQKYIKPTTPPIKLSESIAPFYYYRNNNKVTAGSKPAACVDIGGGTSDIVVFEDNRPILLSSFRFAANSIFGDAFSDFGAAKTNGFVQSYKGTVNNLLTGKLVDVYNKILSSEKSEDIIAFFFSLESNKDIKLPYNFSDLLEKDKTMQMVFVVFYTALVYHLAKMMKAKGKDKPRYITFSGNGSRVLSFVTDNNQTLEKLTKTVFEKIYGTPYDEDGLTIIRERAKPKEVTCKGGLMLNADRDLRNFDFDSLKTTLLGDKNQTFVDDVTGYFSQYTPSVIPDEYQKNITYDDLKTTKAAYEAVKAEVEAFVDFVFDIHKVFNFNDKLMVDMKPIEFYKKILKSDIVDNIQAGLDIRRTESKGKNSTPVSETLFFYPLTAALNQLAFSIYQDSKPV